MADALADYVAWLRVERGLASSSIRAYEREIRALSNPVHIGAYELRAALHSRPAKPATIARRIAAWRSFYGWLTRTGQRSDDPTLTLDRPKVAQGLPRPVADLDAALRKLDPVTQAIALLLAETGLRISEACAISAQVPVGDRLLVHGKGAKDRLIPLTAVARAALDELGGTLPLSSRTIQRRFREAGFTPHRLRHHLGCELAAAGADLGEIQDLLGHASPATTRIYAAYDLDRLRAAQDRRR